MKKISIIVPCYNEEESIPIFYREVVNILKDLPLKYEIIFVDDGSSDQSVSAMRTLSQKDKNVSYLSFSRNFGKESAMYAGFCNAQGDYVTVMDADLQHPPELIPEMIYAIEHEDYDSIATRRVDRKGEPPIRSWFSQNFYKIINRFSDANIVDGACDYRLMKKKMVDAIVAMDEYNRFSKGIFGWVGFKTKWIPFENKERVAGETKWSFWKLYKYAIDGIISFTQAPLSLASTLGNIMTAISFISLAFIIVRKIVFDDPVAGWASTICVIVFIGGMQLAVLGVIGQYLAKTYLESKGRPHFIVSESNREDAVKIR